MPSEYRAARPPRCYPVIVLAATSLLLCSTTAMFGQERPRREDEGAQRPWMTFCIARLDHLLEQIDVLLQAADRPELSEVLSMRYQRWHDFVGVDRTRPLGLLWAWRTDDPETEAEEAHEEVLYLPVNNVQPLLKTVTFDVVPYKEVTPGHFEIDRPGTPYHAMLRDDVLWMGDDPATLRRFSTRPKAFLGDLVRDFDLAIAWDLRQVPAEKRREWADQFRTVFEPLLQRRDDEPADAHAWRMRIGRAGLGMVTEALTRLDRIVVGVKINTLRRRAEVQLKLEGDVAGVGGPSWLAWPARRTSWARLDTPETYAFGSIQLPWSHEAAAQQPNRNTPAECAWQVFGDPYSDRHAVVALKVPGLAEECAAWPAATGDTFRVGEMVFRRVADLPIPHALRRFTGWDPECWCGVKQDEVWWGFGEPDRAAKALQKALVTVQEPAPVTLRPVGMQARMSARDLVPYLQLFSHGWADSELQKGGDNVKFKVEPHAKGINVQLQLDAGLLRLIGASLAEELAVELEHLLAQ